MYPFQQTCLGLLLSWDATPECEVTLLAVKVTIVAYAIGLLTDIVTIIEWLDLNPHLLGNQYEIRTTSDTSLSSFPNKIDVGLSMSDGKANAHRSWSGTSK